MSIKLKAYIITFLIFGGIAYLLFGNSLPSIPKFDFLSSLFDKKEETNKKSSKRTYKSKTGKEGQVVDSYKGVKVFHNGQVKNVFGRNTTKDGYNLGLKYQCVEFGKRFFYEVYRHKMPNASGNAKDFFDVHLANGAFNSKRGMYQFRNGYSEKPKKDDMGIIGPSSINKFGHLFIITKVNATDVEFIQQNPGQTNPSRGRYQLINSNGKWTIKCPDLSGWLRMR